MKRADHVTAPVSNSARTLENPAAFPARGSKAHSPRPHSRRWARRLLVTTAACLTLGAGSASAFSKSSSQDKLPSGMYLGDVDGDGITDFIQFSQNKLFAMKTDFNKTGILHHYFNQNVSRPLIGDFLGAGHDQVCAILANNTIECFGTSPDKEELWWAFTQSSFVSSTDDTFIGDFNGDGADDIMLYNTTSGYIRFYTINSSGFFGLLPSSSLGNLSSVAVPGMRLRVGDFNGDGRSDVLAINSSGQVLRYDSVYSSGVNTFWWAFTTYPVVASGDQITLARVNDDFTDDLVLHNSSTGAYKFCKLAYQNGYLTGINNVSTGQLATGGNKLLYWGKLKADLSEPGGDSRDDALVYDNASGIFVRSDARWDGSAYTYWWAYTQYAPSYNAGWPAIKTNPWLVLLCKFSDQNAEQHDMTWYQHYYTEKGAGWDGVYDYFQNASYDGLSIAGTQIKGWYRMSVSLAQAQSMSRSDRINACVSASGVNTSSYQGVIAVVNATIDRGACGAGVLVDPDLDDDVTFTAHEMLHRYGMSHSWDDSDRQAASWSQPGEYYDKWDVMSAMNVFSYLTDEFGRSGPELNAPYKTKMAWMPSTRITSFTPGSSLVTTSLNLAALNRPEANGPLMAKIGFPGDTTGSHYYSIEFRKKWKLDQGIPQNTVLIHEYVDDLSYLQGYDVGQDWMPGETFYGENGVKIKIESFNSAADTAKVTVTY